LVEIRASPVPILFIALEYDSVARPSDASVHAHIGYAKFCLGRAEETEAHVRETFRLSPRNTFIYLWMVYIGVADLLLGRDEGAVTWLQRSIDNNPNAAALAHCGKLEDARSAAKAGLALDPAFTIAHFRTGAASDNPTYLVQRERISNGMRKAGVPEE
jgi:tetratricopeptide (TPR) repeat protein